MSRKSSPGSPPPERRCRAKSKRSGQQCGKWAMCGRDVCRAHGGATPRGIGLPQSKHLRYSRSVPSRLSQSYAEILGDSKKLDLDNELAVIVARSQEILASLYLGDSDAWRRRLRSEKRRMERARRNGDDSAVAEHLSAIMRMIEHGAPDGERWIEWLDNTEQLRKIAESERKRRVEDQQIVTTEEVMALLGALTGIVMRHVPDERTRQILGRQIDALIFFPGDDPSEN